MINLISYLANHHYDFIFYELIDNIVSKTEEYRVKCDTQMSAIVWVVLCVVSCGGG